MAKPRSKQANQPIIEMLPISSLKPVEKNARTHSKKQVLGLAKSIEEFGVTSPIVIDKDNNIIAGEARFKAYQHQKTTNVPVIRMAHLDDTQIRALRLADNKIASNAGWDREILISELSELQIELPKIGLDLELTGFDIAETDALLGELNEPPKAPLDDVPEVQETAVVKEGDLFVLDDHRLLVGDARKSEDHSLLMDSEIATMAFLDPPYNVKIQGHVGGRGRVKHREFAAASGELDPAEFTEFLRQTCAHAAGNIIDGGIVYICMDWRHAPELFDAGKEVFDELKNICIWNKTTPGQGTFYRSQHEFVFVYKRGKAAHINSFELGQHGRTRSNVWTYPGANSFRAGRLDELKMHPTVKPVALIADALRDCSRRGSIVLDVFAGVGSTIIAAEQVGRRAFCMEIDPLYADAAIRRWQKMTGKDACLLSTGQVFDELAERAQRARPKTVRPHAPTRKG